MTRTPVVVGSIMLATVTIMACRPDSARELVSAPALGVGAPGAQFEVWLLDQSNSPGTNFGGTLYIYDGADLMGAGSPAAPAAVIDLGGATSALCLGSTGTNPVRPHMVAFNGTHTHAVVSFLASGHVVIYDAASRAPIQCIDVGTQARAAIPAPDDSFILVANQNGKLLQRINADFTSNTFALDAAATLDLAACVTPNGVPCQDPTLRPDNAPITPVITPGSDLAFITLRGGGMLVVNPRTSPIEIRAEYGMAVIHPTGVGGVAAGGSMFINSGGGTATTPFGFDVYRFLLSGFSPSAPNAPDSPSPVVLLSDDVENRDAQGMALSRGGRYLWVADRGTNVAEVFDVASGARVRTVELSESIDLAPQLLDFAPTGNRVFFSLRGPTPLTGGAGAAGAVPGLGVFRVTAGGSNAAMQSIERITNLNGGVTETADAHGLAIRRR